MTAIRRFGLVAVGSVVMLALTAVGPLALTSASERRASYWLNW